MQPIGSVGILYQPTIQYITIYILYCMTLMKWLFIAIPLKQYTQAHTDVRAHTHIHTHTDMRTPHTIQSRWSVKRGLCVGRA